MPRSVTTRHILLDLALLFCGVREARPQAPVAVTLTPTPAPAAAEPGVTLIGLTGTNFPAGTILAASVIVTLRPTAAGSPANATVTTPATSVTTVVGTTRRVTFTVPATVKLIAPATYAVMIAGSTSIGTRFDSSNSATLTINPAASLVIVSPNSGNLGQTINVAITGQFSNFLQGSTQAAFGPGITTNSTTVTNATQATANITITAAATPGARTVTMTTGVEVASLANGFTVVNPAPTLTSLSTTPASPLAGQQFSLTLTGANFDPASATIVINGPACTPCTIANAALTAKSANSLTGLATLGAGSFTVAVQNTATGATSGTLTLTVSAVPTLVSFTTTPAPPLANQQFSLTVTGTNFDPTSATIVINGPACTPCTIANATLTARSANSLTGPATLGAGSFTIAVQNTATGATSGPLTLTISALPTLTSFTTVPAPPLASQQFALTVNGTNFDPASATIVINGPACTPCLIANATLTAKSANSLTGPGTLGAGSFTIAVQNTATGATSGTLTLTISALPTLISFTTTPAPPLANQQFSLTVNGTNFDPASATIVINGPACTPCTIANAALTAKSANSLTGPATLGAGSFTIAVQNTATGATSGTLPLTVGSTNPTITSFAPQSGPIGAMVTINGANLGVTPQVTMPALIGGAIALPLQSMSASTLTVVIPSGAVTGPITVTTPTGTAVSATPFTVNAANTFSLSASPASANLIQGQSVAYSVQLASPNGFNQLAQLSVAGLPSGVTASFKPTSITAGQTAILTLTAPAAQQVTSTNISISAAATVTGIPQTQSAPATLAVVAPTTTLLGRTVVSDPLETPLAGVTITTLGQDGNGGTNSCPRLSTVSDSAGNFQLTNLPMQCTGLQLIGFDGTTATSPAGKYAGVNLVFTLVAAQVTASPVLVHLPRIDNVETFMVQQNSATDQSYNFTTIPGLSVTVYAGTTFTMADGTRPNPFPLAAVQVPVDRLPDLKPNVPTMMRVFIVAFQPANTVASQPVAVSFPNVSNTDSGTDMVLMTLDPTHGTMVPYGTGAVSPDGTQVVPDADPAHPGHLYGLQHFDWHGQMPPPPPKQPVCILCWISSVLGLSTPVGDDTDPVDLSSGLQVLHTTDIAIEGTRGSIAIERTYRSLSNDNDSFGLGHELGYAWALEKAVLTLQSAATAAPSAAEVPAAAALSGVVSINLIRPDGDRFPFTAKINGNLIPGTLQSTAAPWLQGTVMTSTAAAINLRFRDGTVYQFTNFRGENILTSITDRNGNTTTLTPAAVNPPRIGKITDPVGRSLTLTYDANSHVSSVTDPIGRIVKYTYNGSGTLATVTDPNGGVTKYFYDPQNRMTSMIDPRGVTMFQDTYDANGRVAQQVRPDGAVIKFSYTLANPLAPTSPVIATTVTDALGNQTTYRFNVQGVPTDVTDAIGQTKSFTLAPSTNLVTKVSGPAQCAVCGPRGLGDMSYTYDAQGNMLTSTDALGNTAKYTYDAVFNQVTSVTDPLNHTSTYAYDATGDLISATDPNGNTSKYSYGANGLLTQATDPLGNNTAITYDNSANPVSVTDALGNVSQTAYDAVSRPTTATDPLGRISKVTFDVLDRVVSTLDGRGSKTQYSYDSVGNLLTLTDPKGNATAFTYDALNRVKIRTSPLGKSESYQYDLNGNLIQYIDRRGQTSNFQYDPLNRLTSETYQDGATVVRTYDPYSRLLTVTDSVGGFFSYGYDLNGSLISQGEPTGTVNYIRDRLHRVATRQVVGQSAVTYSYDAAGNMLGAAMPAMGITYSYDARNLPKTATRTNGVVSNYTFDPLGRVLSLIHSNGAGALNTQTYSYDAVGNRIGATNDISQPLITQAATATVDTANELLTNGQTTYTSDANGNRLTETSPAGTLTYQWDSRNRLSSITDSAGNVTSFKYDFTRNLVEMDKAAAGIATSQKFVVDIVTNVSSLTDASGLPASVLTGSSIDTHYGSIDSAGNVAFGISDILGSTTALTNAAGAITSRLYYEPYGQTTAIESVPYPFAFAGRIQATGDVLYLRNRYYDAAVGKFLSEDPLGPTDGEGNPYRYARSNPTRYRDPHGLLTEREELATGVITAYTAVATIFVTLGASPGWLLPAIPTTTALGTEMCGRLFWGDNGLLPEMGAAIGNWLNETVPTWDSIGDFLYHHIPFIEPPLGPAPPLLPPPFLDKP